MLRFVTLAERPRKLYRMTGLTRDQCQQLTDRLTPLWEQAERVRLSRRPRQHALGQGTQDKLATMADKLLCVLACSRFALTDELLGWLIGLDASNVCRLQQRLEPLIEQAADPSLGRSLRRRLPPGVKQIDTVEQLLEVCPEVAKGRHRCDRATLSSGPPVGRSAAGTKARARGTRSRRRSPSIKRDGSCWSVRACRDAPTTTRSSSVRAPPSRCRGRRSTISTEALDGAATDDPAHHVIVPVKKRRNHRRLTRAERRFNRAQARRRIIVEHVFSRLKTYQVLAQVYRHRISESNRRVRHVAALTNFRLAPTVA